jgi:uncharacterized membrane protein YccC
MKDKFQNLTNRAAGILLIVLSCLVLYSFIIYDNVKLLRLFTFIVLFMMGFALVIYDGRRI